MINLRSKMCFPEKLTDANIHCNIEKYSEISENIFLVCG